MNKKITWEVIKSVALRALLVIIAVTAVGGAVIVHNSFKSTADKTSTSVTTEKADDKTQKKESSTAAPQESKYEYSYAGFNPQVIKTTNDFSKIILNKNYRLPENYEPSLSEAVKDSGIMLDNRVAPYYQAMYDAAKEDGVILNPVAGYRTVEQQKKNFDLRVQENMKNGMDKNKATVEASNKLLLPGTSEHNAGLAVDICSRSESFENTEAFEWLTENAAKYGFILRYPKDEEKQKITGMSYEPWHFRFVGIKAAKKIADKGITLEEYLKLD